MKFFAFLFTAIVVWVMVSPLWGSGRFDKAGNLVFFDFATFRDVTVHLSLIGELLNRFPPTNFAAGGVVLKNYHYFFDIFLSFFARIPGFSLMDLYFRIIPVILSIGLCGAIYLTTLQLTKNKIVAAFAIFFTVFATSFGPIMPYIKTFFGWNHVTGAGNIFMTDQIFSMMVNPQGVLSLTIYLSIFLSFDWYEKSKKTMPLILVTFLLAISFGVKAYGGILFAPAAIITALYFFFKKKDWKPLLAVGFGATLMGLWFLFSIDSRVAGLSFAPFWILGKMMSDADRLNEPSFAPLLEVFFIKKTWWRLILLVSGELVIFLVGSFGFRILGLFSVKLVLKKIKTISIGELFLYMTGLLSLTMPLFFNQTFKAYEVIQFFPYFSLLMGIFFTTSLFSLLEKKRPVVRLAVLLIFVSAFLAFDKQELNQRIFGSTEKIVIPVSEMAAIDYIRKNTDPSATFLVAPSEFNSDYLWFSSLAGRRVVYAGERFDEQIGIDTKMLSQKVQDFFLGKQINLKFDYVFVSQTLDDGSARISNQQNLKLVFEKNGAKVYKYD